MQLVKDFESLRLTAYKCPADVWTIGWGHTKGVNQGDEITVEQAEQLLREDLAEFKAAVDKAVEVHLSETEMEALVSLCYNIGIGAFSKSTLVKKLNDNLRLEAAMEFPKWSKIGSTRSKGLLRRRMKEATLFLS